MRYSFPRKRMILALHRWLGGISALFLVSLALTGLALNHTERLGLDRVQLDAGWLLQRYNMESGKDIISYRVDETTMLSRMGESLFINAVPLGRAGEPVGVLSGEDILVVATAKSLFLLTPDAELVETMDTTALPFEGIQFLGRDGGGQPLVVAEGQAWLPDAAWLEFTPQSGPFSVLPLEPATLPPDLQAELLRQHRGEGVSLYRVLLDLHSGRLFGWGGRTLMDLSAVAILILVGTGLSAWVRRSRVVRRER